MASVIARAQDANTRVSKRDRYLSLRNTMFSDRSTFDAHWREIGDFLKPTRTRFYSSQRNQGGKHNQNILDSTATFAHRTLSSGMHAGLTSPAREWFKLTTPDKGLARRPNVKSWLHEVTRRLEAVLAGSNIYNHLPIVYEDMGGWGTGAMAVLEDAKDLFRAQTFPIGSYAIAVDNKGLVSTFVRDYEMTVENVVEMFGVKPGYRDIDWSRISATIKNLWDDGNYQAPVEICWIVQPNRYVRAGSPFSQDLPFSSCHFEKGSDKKTGDSSIGFLRESGFETMPIMAPRWSVTGEDNYGTDCPGMTALGDIKQLQGEQREKAKAIKKMVDPPMKGSPELRTQKTSIISGDITYVREPQHGFSPVHEVRIDLDHLRMDIQDVRYLIQRAFYEDLFLMLASSDQGRGTQPITAREVDERHEEKLLALGPVIERTDVELLDPLIDRVYLLMDKAGLIPDAPPELEGVKLKVEYTSIMAQAQKLTGVVGLDRFVASIAPLVEADQSLLYRIDGDVILEEYQDALGVNPNVLRPKEDADAMRQQAAEAQQGQQRADVMAQLARAAKDGSQARMGSDSALDRVAGNVATAAQ